MICDNIFTKCTYDGINLRIIYGDVIKKEKKKKKKEKCAQKEEKKKKREDKKKKGGMRDNRVRGR